MSQYLDEYSFDLVGFSLSKVEVNRQENPIIVDTDKKESLFKEQYLMNEEPNQNNSVNRWERLIGLLLAAIVIFAFLYYIFKPPPSGDLTFGIVRFLAAMTAGFSSYLFLGSIDLSGRIPLTQIQARAAGAFGIFLAVFFLFGWGVPSNGTNNNLSLQEKQAIAFDLGWNSKALLLPETVNRTAGMAKMSSYLERLDVSLNEPVRFYLTSPQDDGGQRAQEFTEIVYGQLEGRHGRNVAIHFAVPNNLLLIIAHNPIPTTDIKSQIQELINRLNIPQNLKKIPDRELLDWANSINAYFQTRLP